MIFQLYELLLNKYEFELKIYCDDLDNRVRSNKLFIE